jgi:iron complex transport system substrate-binding protein
VGKGKRIGGQRNAAKDSEQKAKLFDKKYFGTVKNNILERRHKMKKLILIVLMVACLLVYSVVGCALATGKETPAPLMGTIVDQFDRTVTIPKLVERVVSLLPEGTRVIVALGAGDKLVGVDSRSIKYFSPDQYTTTLAEAYPEGKDLPDVGSITSPNVELIASLKPDVIIGGWCYPPEVADEIQDKIGIPVVCVYTKKTIDDTFEEIKIIGKVIGKEKEARELVSYLNGKLAKVIKVTSQIPDNEKPKVYLSFWSAITKTPIVYEPVNIAGGVNVAGDIAAGTGGWGKGRLGAQVSIEQILHWNPDIILVHHSGSKSVPTVSVEDVLSEPALEPTNAVRNCKVCYTPGMISGWEHPRLFAEILYMAKLFHPDKFKDMDVEKEGNEIFKRFYGVNGLWTELSEKCGYYKWE